MPRDLAEKLRSAGVFRRYVPRSHGGDEMWPDEGLTVIEELARADASVAWVAAVGSEAVFYAYLPADAYDKIYAGGPDVIHTGVINATGRAVRVDGGYRFSGRWSFASGSNNADYICIHGVIEGEQATRLGVVRPARSRSKMSGTSAGSRAPRATTSWSATCSSPRSGPGTSRSCRSTPGTRSTSDNWAPASARSSPPSLSGSPRRRWTTSPTSPATRSRPPRAASSRPTRSPSTLPASSPPTCTWRARCCTRSGRDDQASVAFGPPDERATALRRARLSRAASVAASVVEGAYGLSGTTGLFESCPLQRRLRDVRAVTQHYMLSARSAFGPVGTGILSED